jgi:hypothetical protein
MTPDSVTIDYHISVNSRVMDIQITDLGFIQKVELDYDSEYFYFDTHLRSKHMSNMCMRLRNAGKGEALPSLFPRFAPNTHIYLYASTVHMYCIYPAILNRK